jgi:hypothetical protein
MRQTSLLYLLLALIVIVMVGMTAAAALGCLYMTLAGKAEIGACVASGVVQQVRETWAEAIAVVLALLLASRNNGGTPKQ